MNPFYREIAGKISAETGCPFEIARIANQGGGCINDTVRLDGADGSSWFIKSNTGADISVFESELDGLKSIADTKTIRVPKPLCLGEAHGQAWFAMEFIELVGAKTGSQEQLGRQLASLHKIKQPQFGWHRANTIGSTPQQNPNSDDWIDFWREHRLGFQLRLAEKNGGTFSGADELSESLDTFFEDHEPQPSLLHGDLWSGNISFAKNGEPVIYDPACYFGDREAEFGIINMFGGFTDEFYQGYNSVWPFDVGFENRLPLYELYHTLNHFNIFGPSYGASCQRLIDQLVKNF
jgi:protein-ribulosamine 3-kinase